MIAYSHTNYHYLYYYLLPIIIITTITITISIIKLSGRHILIHRCYDYNHTKIFEQYANPCLAAAALKP